MRKLSLLALTAALSACAHQGMGPPTLAIAPVDERKAWEKLVLPDDARRLAALPAALAAARVRAERRAPAGRMLAAAALAHPEVTPGSYDCRLIRIGPGRGVRLYPPGFCNVRGGADGRMSFAQQTGGDAPGG